jgi:GTP-binding protein
LNDKIKALSVDGKLVENAKVLKLFSRDGLTKVSDTEAFAGDIISVAGCEKAGVTDTLCALTINEAIDTKPLDPPIISVMIQANDSPLAGKEGKHCSSILLRNRLLKEGESNITLQIKPQGGEKFEILARGEMQVGILVETMRREGFELAVSSPQVLYRRGENQEVLEPIENLTIECEENEYQQVSEKLSQRKGDLIEFKKVLGGKIQLKFSIPTRCLIGFRSEFITLTRGAGVIHSILESYQPYKGDIESSRKGVLVSMASGKATAYALQPLEARGQLFITPQTPIYEGMIVGACAKEKDLPVNPCKEKHLV